MTCQPYRDKDGRIVGIMCGKGLRAEQCACGAPIAALCDFEVEPAHRQAPAKTCDKPLCAAHRRVVGKNRDYCLDHPLAPGDQPMFSL